MSMRRSFLDDIKVELELADPNSMLDDCLDHVYDGEIVVGKMDDDLKKLFVVINDRMLALDLWIEEVDQEEGTDISKIPEERKREILRCIYKAETQINALQILFEASVRYKFDLYGQVLIAVRRGFQIVQFKSSPLESILSAIGINPSRQQKQN